MTSLSDITRKNIYSFKFFNTYSGFDKIRNFLKFYRNSTFLNVEKYLLLNLIGYSRFTVVYSNNL